MRLTIPHDFAALGTYIPRFLDLVGKDRWFKRAEHLASEQRKSFFRWKIVRDYHWLELVISFQSELLDREGRLQLDAMDELDLAGLNFAATTVEVHAHLSQIGRQNLEGRLRDGLKAETGYAPLYLELALAQRLMDAGFEVTFPDLERTAQFDLLFSNRNFTAEVECKSLSADAGRQIHRKDFYRFMDALLPALETQKTFHRREALVITLDGRLSPNVSDQTALLGATRSMLCNEEPPVISGNGFALARHDFNAVFGASISDEKALYKACGATFGPNTHMAGGATEEGGCIVIMRSKREDDTSKPMLDAMRKAASQFSCARPAFIAIQEHGIEAADLMLPRLRRRTGILSYALYSHYGASHVNATYVTGYGAVVAHENGILGSPGFAVPNPEPKFSVTLADTWPFLAHIPDELYAAAIRAPLPASNISCLPLDLDELGDTNS